MAKLVACISIFLFVLGIVVAAYGYLVLGGRDDPITSDYNPGFNPDVSGENLALIAGILCVVTSIFGFATAKFKNFCFALPFMILSILIGLLMLVRGAITSGAAGYMAQMKIQACDTVVEGSDPAITYKLKIGDEYTKMVDRLMCSFWCPCPAEAESVWTNVSEEKLQNFTRLDQTRTSMTADQCSDLITKQMDADIIPLSFSTTTCGTTSPSSIEVVSNYGECYNKNLKPIFDNDKALPDAQKDANLQKTQVYVQQFFEKGGYDFLGQLEEKYNCASMCQTPLFYLKKNVADGPPTVDCVTAAIDDLSDNMVIAVIFVITGLLSLIAAAGAFPLCSGTKKKNEHMMDNDDM